MHTSDDMPDTVGNIIYAIIKSCLSYRSPRFLEQVVEDVPIHSDTSLMTLLISRSIAQSFGGSHRGMICVCAFLLLSVCMHS